MHTFGYTELMGTLAQVRTIISKPSGAPIATNDDCMGIDTPTDQQWECFDQVLDPFEWMKTIQA
jgi:hypothetical protein